MKTEEEMLQRLAAVCAGKECCLQELREKLIKAELPEGACERVLAKLQEMRFVDEARYARSFVNDKFRFNHWGRIKINYALSQKGIPAAVRQSALEAIDESAYREQLVDLLRSKLRTLHARNAYELIQKLLRFASSRGFESALILDCARSLLNEDVDEALDSFNLE